MERDLLIGVGIIFAFFWARGYFARPRHQRGWWEIPVWLICLVTFTIDIALRHL